MVEQGLPHGFMTAEQEVPHQESTIEYKLFPPHESGSMDEDIQCLKGAMDYHIAAVCQLRVLTRNMTGTQASGI